MKLLKMRPTRLGYYLLGLNFILMILAIGYSNNLLFLFALILLAQTILWLAQSAGYSRMLPTDMKISNCFAGEFCSFTLQSVMDFKKLTLRINGKDFRLQAPLRDGAKILTSVNLEKRGKYLLEELTLFDSRPFGLFAKKVEVPIGQVFYVYPALMEGVSLHELMKKTSLDGELDSHLKGEEDFGGLTPYQGEDFKKISWKYFARTEEVYVRQGVTPLLDQLDLALGSEPSEEQISQMASLMVLAHKNQLAFSLKIGSLLIPAASGPGHLQYCLERLSEC